MNNQDLLDTIEGILIMIGLLGAKIGWGRGRRESDSEERQQIIALLRKIEKSLSDSMVQSNSDDDSVDNFGR